MEFIQGRKFFLFILHSNKEVTDNKCDCKNTKVKEQGRK